MKTYNKEDVARTQLEEAIKLFFEQRDPVSIHTLMGAAHQILRDIAKANKVEYQCLIEKLIESTTNKEDYKEAYNAAFEPRNFYKHANRDSGLTICFDGEENEMWLLDACHLYGQVASKKSQPVTVYQAWYLLKNRDIALAAAPELLQFAEFLEADDSDFQAFRDWCETN